MHGSDFYKRIKQTVDSVTAEDEQQLVLTVELPRSDLPSELTTQPQSHTDTPFIPNSYLSLKNGTKNVLFKLITN